MTARTRRRAVVAIGVLSVLLAGQAIDGRDARAGAPGDVTVADVRPADPHGVVAITSLDTTIHIVGWGRNEVSIRGSVGAGNRIEFHVSGGRTHVRVMPAGAGSHSGDLEVRVPAGSVVESRTVSGDVAVRDVTGALHLESVSGKIQVTGAPAEVSARSTSGDVTVDASTPQARARSVSGAVRVRGARTSAQVESVSGSCDVSGGPFERVEARTVSGAVTLDGSLASQGSIEIHTHSGNVRMIVPAATSGEFEIRSHHGTLTSRLGADRSNTGSLEFKAGSGGPVVRVRTFSGDVGIEARK